MPRCASGSPKGLASTSTTRLPTPHGSIKWNAGSDSSPNRPSGEAPSRASRTSSQKSTASPTTTTSTAAPSHGQPLQILSFKNSPNYAHVFLGQHVRNLLKLVPVFG